MTSAFTSAATGGASEHDNGRVRLLSEVASALSAAGSVDAVMRALAKAFVPEVCDGFEVALTTPGGPIRRIGLGVDELGAWTARESMPVPDTPSHPVRIALATRATQVMSLDNPDEAHLLGSPEDPTSARSLGVRFALVAPMTGRAEVFGTIGAGLGPSGRTWRTGDIELISSVARLAGLALENLESLEQQRRTVAMLERAAVVGAAMAKINGESGIAEAAVSLAREELGASSGFVFLRDDHSTLRMVAQAGYDEAVLVDWQAIEGDAEVPAADAFRTGQLLALGNREEIDRQYPELGRNADYGDRAFVAAPIVAGSEPLGAVYWGFDEGRRLGPGECRFAELIAEQCAAGITRARAEVARSSAAAQLRIQTGELEASRERLAALAGAGVIGIVSGEEDRVLEANDAFLEMLELTSADAAGGISMQGRTPPEWADADSVIGDRMRTAGRCDPYEKEFLRADGSRVPVMVGGVALSSVPFRWIIFVADITALRAAEQRAEEALVTAERARGAVELMLDEQRHIASTLQRSMLPSALPEIAGVELAAYHWPGGTGVRVSGDFYDVFPVGESRWGLLIGDVCGKGVEAAVVTSVARHTARAAALHLEDPAEVLRWVHDAIAVQSEGRFCTVAYGVLHLTPKGATLSLSLGGHPQPVRVNRNGSEFLGRAGTLLGTVEPTLHRTDLVLEPGDLVAFYTDGITDAPGGQNLTEAELAALLVETWERDLHEIAAVLRTELGARRGRQEQDDTALLLVRIGLPGR